MESPHTFLTTDTNPSDSYGNINNDLQTPLLEDSNNELSPQQAGGDDHHDDDGGELMVATSSSTVGAEVSPDETPYRQSTWYSNPMLVAMLSNYSTAYNVVNISLVIPILKALYTNEDDDSDYITTEDEAALASSLLAGMIAGQLIGGALGDSRLGRLGALRLVMALQIIASIGSALSSSTLGEQANGAHDDDNATAAPLYTKSTNSTTADDSEEAKDAFDLCLQLTVWRFFLGVGAGGVYPLSAVLSAEQQQIQGDDQNQTESVSTNNRSGSSTENDDGSALHRVVVTFSMQGLGFVSIPLVAVFLLYAMPQNLEAVWRTILGLGAVPGLALMVLQWYILFHKSKYHQRVRLEEPSDDQFAAHQGDNNDNVNDSNNGNNARMGNEEEEEEGIFRREDDEVAGEEHPRGLWASVRQETDLGRKLLGTAVTWFLFDILWYGNSLFQPIIIEAVFSGDASSQTTELELLQHTAVNSLILTTIALPGYAVAGMVLGTGSCITLTPRFVMLQGFAAMSLLYLIIGLGWDKLLNFPFLLILLYSLTFFFSNCGPNTTTFVLPSLVYSDACRSTLNGLSAAIGKIGALVGTTMFAPVANDFGDAVVMIICAIIGVVAFVITHQFVQPTTN